MALDDRIKELQEELKSLDAALKGIGLQIKDQINDQLEGLDEATRKVAQSFQNDLGRAISGANRLLNNQQAIFDKIKKGQDASKDIEKEITKVRKEREVVLRKLQNLEREGVDVSAEQQAILEAELEAQEAQLIALNEINTAQISQRGITGNILENAKQYLTSLDKSGLSAKLLNSELDGTQKGALAAEAAFIAIAKATLEGSNRIAALEKNLGISYGSAYQLQLSLAQTANSSEKLFITSKDLNKSFTDLVQTTGLLSDFGGDTLITMTTLTKQLGFATKEASQLAFLARTQGEDTESVLDNTVETVNAINRQNKTAISAKAVLNDIATASNAIVVSLGMSPEILAEAATEARGLGLNLQKVDQIAGSLLNFESSITAELEAELLLGEEISLEKARQAALNNDLATLTKEIGENEAITNAFATGNRIQQEAAAKALGMQRDDLADMVMQQEMINLSQDEFIAKYGEQSYQQMQAQSASEKFAATMEKIQGIISDIGTIFAPIVDMFASVLGYLAKSEIAIYAISGALGAMAIKGAINAANSMREAVAKIFSSSFKANPYLGIALAGAGVGALYAAARKAQNVQDGIAPSSKGPFTITDAYGAMAVTAKGDSIVASPNITNSANSADGEQRRTNALLERLLNKDSNVYMDSDKVGTAFAKNASF